MSIRERVSLPREVIRLSEGLRSIQEEVLHLTHPNERVFSPPDGWVWDGEQPVITSVSPSVDKVMARGLFRHILELLVTCKPEWAGDAGKLKAVGEDDFCRLIEYTIKGENPDFNRIIKTLGIAPEAAGFVFFHTVRPFLKLYSMAACSSLNLDEWMENYCPVCGGKPSLARVERGDGRRYLKCDHCGHEWLFRLLACPRCGNDDHSSLVFLRIEETPGYELHVCECCHGYIKVVNEKTGGDRRVMEDEAATVYLDLIAEQQGYRTDTGNA